jgi:hypothetical protein
MRSQVKLISLKKTIWQKFAKVLYLKQKLECVWQVKYLQGKYLNISKKIFLFLFLLTK